MNDEDTTRSLTEDELLALLHETERGWYAKADRDEPIASLDLKILLFRVARLRRKYQALIQACHESNKRVIALEILLQSKLGIGARIRAWLRKVKANGQCS